MTTPTDLLSHFGFHTLPFTREITVKDRFALALYEEPLGYLQRALANRMSAALIAPAGTGKTALLRALCARLPETRYRVHYVKVTDVSKRDLCREIAAAVELAPAGTYPVLVRRLQERFDATLQDDAQRPVLVLDEAHGLRPEVLGVLCTLTNFAMDSRLVVSLLLSGQPPLAALLRQDRFADVTHRLAHCATLRPLSRTEIASYITHRCTVAGCPTPPFDRGAQEAIYEIARGNLRATDHLGLKALEIAHEAQAQTVDAEHATTARRLLWP
jgi:type II secretory pathway predicted ATPase ExeA